MGNLKITDAGRALLTELLNSNYALEIVKAIAGKATTNQDGAIILIEGAELAGLDYSKRRADQYTLNCTLEDSALISSYEIIGLYARRKDSEDAPILYGYLDYRGQERRIYPNQKHYFEIIMLVSDGVDVQINIPMNGYLQQDDADERYAKKHHGHIASLITQSSGESLEEAQQRQDFYINYIMRNFGNTCLQWSFSPDDINGSNIVRGIISENSIYCGGV